MIGVERTDFVMVITDDKELALEFYGETLGLQSQPNAHADWPEFETGNVTLRSCTTSRSASRSRPTPLRSRSACRMSHEAAPKLEEAGVDFVSETYDSDVCHLAVFADPDGNRILLHRRYAPYPDGTTP